MWKLLQYPCRAVVIFALTDADKHLADMNNSELTRAGLQLLVY